MRKAGHAGTLDPFATGLLLVLVGRAPRAQRFLMALPKTYEAVARLGAVSTTGDPEGEITETGVLPPEPFVLPTGLVRQRPPIYSAVQIAGRARLRARARGRDGRGARARGHRLPLRAALARGRPRRLLRSSARSGTYVRSLIADLGDAYCEELRRTRVGPFDVADADPARVLPLERALSFLPRVDARRRGRLAREPRAAVAGRGARRPRTGEVLLVDADGPVAIAEPRDGALLKPIVGFRA